MYINSLYCTIHALGNGNMMLVFGKYALYFVEIF